MWPFSKSAPPEPPPIASFRLVGAAAEEFLRLHDKAMKERREGLKLAEFKLWDYLSDKTGYGVDYLTRFEFASDCVLVYVMRRRVHGADIKDIAT